MGLPPGGFAGSGDVESFATGPAVGAAVPDFELPDQQGRPVRLSAYRGKQRALILFYRSASW